MTETVPIPTVTYPLGLRRLAGLTRYELDAHTDPLQNVVGEVERSPAGNTVIRIGQHDRRQPGWQQCAYLVLTPDEREVLIGDLMNHREPADPTAGPQPVRLTLEQRAGIADDIHRLLTDAGDWGGDQFAAIEQVFAQHGIPFQD
jgi:hypothetical protein